MWVAIAVMDVLAYLSIPLRHPSSVLLLAVVIGGFIGGVVSGLINAVLAVIFIFFAFLMPADHLVLTRDSLLRTLVFVVVAPTMGALVGILRRRDLQQVMVHEQAIGKKALLESHRRLRLALNAARMGTWERDLATGKDIWSENEEALFGFSPGSFPRTHEAFLERVHPDDRQALAQAVQQAIDAGLPYSSEYRVVRPDESVRWMSGQGDVVRDESGKATHLLGVTLDITERKLAEQEHDDLLVREQRARAEAETANRRKDQFLAILSHELRTPLTPVLAAAGLLKRNHQIPASVQGLVDMIRRNVELEATLIDDLLDMTRISTGKLKLNFQPVDAHAVLLQALDIYREELATRHLQIVSRLDADPHEVHGDPSRLQQVFWNLIGNAVKFTPAGGTITIRSSNVELAQAQSPLQSNGRHCVRIEVSDTGVGIEPEVMGRLFTAFEQGEQSLSRRFGGLGLGLAICKSLVQMHGGAIAAQSEGKNKGTTLIVDLPVGAPAEVRTIPTPPAQTCAVKARHGRRILLVEDNEDTMRLMARLLRNDGHEVRTATGVRAAVDAANDNLDLLICDIGLPDGSGWELMRQLRAARSDRPIPGIALSGFGSDDDIRRSHESGFVCHLTKPVNLQQLEDTIQQVAN